MPRCRCALALLLLALALPASAERHVYRCIEAGQPVSLQSEPCPAGARTASATPFAPSTESAASAPARAVAAPGRLRAARRSPARVAAAPRNECQDTRDARDRWEREVGLRRTYDALRSWNDRVARACR